ncbi:MAG: hypothetical protein K2O18_02145 [Oscillospiraceae bacterium]|nr:hypothetical protein [Oscillospiraceae bacterium]
MSKADDRKVEKALLKKALGYTEDVAKTYKLKRIEYQDGKKVLEVEELAQGVDQTFVPPDLASQIFWLKNRKPKEWKEKVSDNLEQESAELFDHLMREFKDEVERETD